jgi:hypothetical protein
VSDDGVGFDTEARFQGHYGLSVVFNSGLKSLGHEVSIKSEIGKGTEVNWKLGNFLTRQESIGNFAKIAEWPRLSQDNINFRYLFLAIPFVIGTLMVLLTSGFNNQDLIVVQYSIYLFLLWLYATLEPARWRVLLLLMLIGMIYWGQLSLINQTPSCVAAQPIQWIVNGYTVGMLLIVLSSIPIIVKAFILAGNLLIQGLVATSLGDCQEFVLLPGLTGSVIAIGMVYGISKLTAQNLLTVAEFQSALEISLGREMKQQASDITFLRMRELTGDARKLLIQIHEASEDFDKIRIESFFQESFLRSALQIMESTSDEVQEALLEMLSRLTRQKVLVSLENWATSLENVNWPEELTKFGVELSNSLHNGKCKLFFIDQGETIYFVVEADGEFSIELTPRAFVTETQTGHIKCEIELTILKNTSQQIEQLH